MPLQSLGERSPYSRYICTHGSSDLTLFPGPGVWGPLITKAWRMKSIILHKRAHDRVLGIGLGKISHGLHLRVKESRSGGIYHWSDVWMEDSLKFGESQLVVRADVDEGNLVYRHVAVFGSGED